MNDGPSNPLINWRDLEPAERLEWWQDLWLQTVALADRYRLPLRTGWWEDSLQVEALAAFCAWLQQYDSAAYFDAQGKLQLLWELERLKAVLRPGEQAFDSQQDQAAYEHHLAAIGCHGDPETVLGDKANEQALRDHRRRLAGELAEILERLRELDEREQLLKAQLEPTPRQTSQGEHTHRDLAQLTQTISQLRRRRQELHCQLDEIHDD